MEGTNIVEPLNISVWNIQSEKSLHLGFWCPQNFMRHMTFKAIITSLYNCTNYFFSGGKKYNELIWSKASVLPLWKDKHLPMLISPTKACYNNCACGNILVMNKNVPTMNNKDIELRVFEYKFDSLSIFICNDVLNTSCCWWTTLNKSFIIVKYVFCFVEKIIYGFIMFGHALV